MFCFLRFLLVLLFLLLQCFGRGGSGRGKSSGLNLCAILLVVFLVVVIVAYLTLKHHILEAIGTGVSVLCAAGAAVRFLEVIFRKEKKGRNKKKVKKSTDVFYMTLMLLKKKTIPV